MMFPTNDPFAYPNHPITSLEEAQLAGEEMSQGVSSSAGLLPGSPSGIARPFGDTSMDMQIFGMPPYLMQGQQPGLSGINLGLFDSGDNSAAGAPINDPWSMPENKDHIDWGAWGEGSFGG